MAINWETAQPVPRLDDLARTLVREIAERFINKGTGLPDHAKWVELGKDRHLLSSLTQKTFIANIANKFYPSFAALYFLTPELRARCEEATTLVFKAFQALYRAGVGQTFSLVQISEQINRMSSEPIGAQTARLGMLFTRDFPGYFYNSFEYSPDAPIKGATVLDNILDFEDLAQAWQEEFAQRFPQAAGPTSEPTSGGGEKKAAIGDANSQSKQKRVFVIHGRDIRLRHGTFIFLRALGLEPIEWIKATQLTGKASPYIGEILDAAFKHAQAAVVLLSPDDEARLRSDLQVPDDPPHERTLSGQARPNVLFEAGMAFASHSDKTVLVQFGAVRPFSDVAGRHIVRMDNSPQKRHELASKLMTAGCAVDMGGADWQSIGDLTPPNNAAPATEETKPTPSAKKRPNLTLKKEVYLGTLYLLGGIWSKALPAGIRYADRENSYRAIFAEIKNAGKSGEEVGAVHDVKAEMVVGKDEYMPLPWLDNRYNSVDFDFGAVRYVVLAVGMASLQPQLGDWRVVINHRDDAYLPGSMDFDHHLKRIIKAQRIRLNLLHVESGTVLHSFEGECEWREGSGIPHIHFE